MNVVSYAQIAFKKLIVQAIQCLYCSCALTGLVRGAFSPDKTLQNVFKWKRWCVEHPIPMMQELQLWQLRKPFFVFFLKNFRSLMKPV